MPTWTGSLPKLSRYGRTWPSWPSFIWGRAKSTSKSGMMTTFRHSFSFAFRDYFHNNCVRHSKRQFLFSLRYNEQEGFLTSENNNNISESFRWITAHSSSILFLKFLQCKFQCVFFNLQHIICKIEASFFLYCWLLFFFARQCPVVCSIYLKKNLLLVQRTNKCRNHWCYVILLKNSWHFSFQQHIEW